MFLSSMRRHILTRGPTLVKPSCCSTIMMQAHHPLSTYTPASIENDLAIFGDNCIVKFRLTNREMGGGGKSYKEQQARFHVEFTRKNQSSNTYDWQNTKRVVLSVEELGLLLDSTIDEELIFKRRVASPNNPDETVPSKRLMFSPTKSTKDWNVSFEMDSDKYECKLPRGRMAILKCLIHHSLPLIVGWPTTPRPITTVKPQLTSYTTAHSDLVTRSAKEQDDFSQVFFSLRTLERAAQTEIRNAMLDALGLRLHCLPRGRLVYAKTSDKDYGWCAVLGNEIMSLDHVRSLPNVVGSWALPSQAQGRIDMVKLVTRQYREFWIATNTILNVSATNLRFEGGRDLVVWRQHKDVNFLSPDQGAMARGQSSSPACEVVSSYCMIKAFAQYVGSQSGDLATNSITIADLQRKYAYAYSQATSKARAAQFMLLDALASDWEAKGAANHYLNTLGGQYAVSTTLRRVSGAVPRCLADFQDSITILSLDQLRRVVRPQARAHEKNDLLRSSRLYMLSPAYIKRNKLVYVKSLGLCWVSAYHAPKEGPAGVPSVDVVAVRQGGLFSSQVWVRRRISIDSINHVFGDAPFIVQSPHPDIEAEMIARRLQEFDPEDATSIAELPPALEDRAKRNNMHATLWKYSAESKRSQAFTKLWDCLASLFDWKIVQACVDSVFAEPSYSSPKKGYGKAGGPPSLLTETSITTASSSMDSLDAFPLLAQSRHSCDYGSTTTTEEQPAAFPVLERSPSEGADRNRRTTKLEVPRPPVTNKLPPKDPQLQDRVKPPPIVPRYKPNGEPLTSTNFATASTYRSLTGRPPPRPVKARQIAGAIIQPDLHGNAFVRADDGKEHAQDDHPLWF